MNPVTFILLLVIAAIASGAVNLINGPWATRPFIALFVGFAIVLILPTLLPIILGG